MWLVCNSSNDNHMFSCVGSWRHIRCPVDVNKDITGLVLFIFLYLFLMAFYFLLLCDWVSNAAVFVVKILLSAVLLGMTDAVKPCHKCVMWIQWDWEDAIVCYHCASMTDITAMHACSLQVCCGFATTFRWRHGRIENKRKLTQKL